MSWRTEVFLALILLLIAGFYLMHVLGPEAPAEAPAPTPKQIDVPRRNIPLTPPVVVAPKISGEREFWNFMEEWNTNKDRLTPLSFELWAKTQGNTKVSLSGTVHDVDDTFGECTVVVHNPTEEPHLEHLASEFFQADCADVQNFASGDTIQVVCTIGGKNFLDAPDLQECEVL
jgi:hypothetical protein